MFQTEKGLSTKKNDRVPKNPVIKQSHVSITLYFPLVVAVPLFVQL